MILIKFSRILIKTGENCLYIVNFQCLRAGGSILPSVFLSEVHICPHDIDCKCILKAVSFHMHILVDKFNKHLTVRTWIRIVHVLYMNKKKKLNA